MSSPQFFLDNQAILPVDITPTNLLVSTVPEPDASRVWPDGTTGEVAWVTGTNYTKGARAYVSATRRVYRDSAGGASSIRPDLDPARWGSGVPANKWAWADGRTYTKTTGTSPMIFTVKPGAISRIAVLGAEGVATVKVDISNGGNQVFSQSYTLSDYRPGPAWWAWFFMKPAFGDRLLIDPLPPYPDGEVTITLSGKEGSVIAVGQICMGNPLSLGNAEWGIEATPRDTGYSITDDWGETVDRPGVGVKDLSGTCVLPIEQANEVMRNFEKLLLRPGVYIAHKDSRYRCLMTGGVLTSARMKLENQVYARCTYEVSGRT